MKIPEDKEFDELVENFRKIAKDENEMIQLLGEEVLKRFLQFASPNSNKKEKLSIDEPSSTTLGNKQKFSETENEEHHDHHQQTNTAAATPEAISKKASLLKEKSLKKPSVSGKKRPSFTQRSWYPSSIDQIFSAQNSNNKKLTIKEPSDTHRKFSEIEKEKHHDHQETYTASTFEASLGNKQKFSETENEEHHDHYQQTNTAAATPETISKKARLLKEKSLKKPSVSGTKRPSFTQHSWHPPSIDQIFSAQNSNNKKLTIKEPSDTHRKFSENEKEKHHDHQETYTDSTFEASKKARLLKERSLKKPISISSRKRPKLDQPHSRYPQPELPMEIKNVIERLGGSEAKLVIEKEVYETDMHPHHDRISIPKNQVRVEFLNDQEKNEIENNDGIRVRVIEPCLRETILSLRQWQLRSSISYVLNSGWKYVAARAENQLKVKDKVQVWSFRVNGELRLAVVRLPRGNLEGGQNSNDSQTTEDEVTDEDEDEDEDEAGPSTSPSKGGKAPESQKI